MPQSKQLSGPLGTFIRQRGPITWRSVLLGILGTLVICILLPYNDGVLSNTSLVGNAMPASVLAMTVLFAVLVNAPLSRFVPQHALSTGELGVAFAITLVGCSVPGCALMRYLPASLVYPHWYARSDPELAALLKSLALSDWLWPSFASGDRESWPNDPIVTGYAGRWTAGGTPPYLRWLVPAAVWGCYVFLLYGAVFCLMTLVHRQWFENERLAFPLASIELALVEAPPAGRWLNSTLCRRGFWICFALVFALHSWNTLCAYLPRHFPEIPVSYSLGKVLSEPPWVFTQPQFKSALLYLTAAGIAFFISGSMSFSLWFVFVLQQIARVCAGTWTGNSELPGQQEQQIGAIFAYLLLIAWIGRHHWMLVLRQATRGHRADEPRGTYLSYRAAFWGMLVCWVGTVFWMMAAGATLPASLGISVTVMLGFIVVGRMVAEAGLLHPGTTIAVTKPWFLMSLATSSQPIPVSSFYLASNIGMLHHDPRESFSVFSSHAMKVVDRSSLDVGSMAHDASGRRRIGRRLVIIFAVTIVMAYFVSFGSFLRTEYHHAVSQLPANTRGPTGSMQPVDVYTSTMGVHRQVTDPSLRYANNRYQPTTTVWGNAAGGFVVCLALSALRVQFVWWPIHPIGYLCAGTWPLAELWFSFFIGWTARTLVLKYGGAKLYQQAKVLVLGVIIGEAVAAAFWLLVGILMNLGGLDVRSIHMLPA